jgi:oxygen-independent coproporphyrinogen-3 oxidase
MPTPVPIPLGLYVHFPWCIRKCPYCDFNSHGVEGPLPERKYVRALLRDLQGEVAHLGGRSVATVFMGGGTPSLFSPEAVDEFLQGMTRHITLETDAEITLEANPGTAEAERFRGYRQAGVNRLSMGVQSFHDEHLRSLGRVHDGAEAERAAQWAQEAGFDNFNLDLMFGLPGQSAEQAAADVEKAVSLSPSHISFYQLTLEANTLFHKHPPILPEDDVLWGIQESGLAVLARSGYVRYEISAYSMPDKRCRHNENYWKFGDYLAIGAGAHGKITRADGSILRYRKQRQPRRYLETAGSEAALEGQETVASADLPVEFLMNHLRLREGFALPDFTRRTGLPLQVLQPTIARNLQKGLLELDGEQLRCTDSGWNFLDNVLESFMESV